jgi:GNAT superfamily N-acetyltransferase
MDTIRPATLDDLPRCHDVWLATEGIEPISDRVLPLHEHERATGTLLVAESDPHGVVGFGATLTRSGVTYLADLFVLPDRQGHGIGRALLHALLDDAVAARAPRFTMASGSPSARALYERFGMAPSWDLSYLLGEVAALDRSALDADGVTARPGVSIDDVATLDLAVTGRDRRADLVHETSRLGGTLLALTRGDGVVGHAIVIQPTWWVPWRPHGTRVAPVVVADAADAPSAVAAAVHWAIAAGASVINSFVPVGHSAHDVLLDAGFRRTDADLHMTSGARLLDPERYLPSIDTV